MNPYNRPQITHYMAIASVALGAGLLLSFGQDGTWWILVLAGLAWFQSRSLRRNILTSGLPLQLFSIVAWALLGFAMVSLLPDLIRIIGDVVVLMLAIGMYLYIRSNARRPH